MKKIRTGVYAFILKDNNILTIKKGRGPFKGNLDLVGGKIEHYENHILALKREIFEETGLKQKDYKINKLFSVEEDFINHTWEGKFIEEHIIGIIYLVELKKNDINLSHKDLDGDAESIKIIGLNNKKAKKTNILRKVILKYKKEIGQI